MLAHEFYIRKFRGWYEVAIFTTMPPATQKSGFDMPPISSARDLPPRTIRRHGHMSIIVFLIRAFYFFRRRNDSHHISRRLAGMMSSQVSRESRHLHARHYNTCDDLLSYFRRRKQPIFSNAHIIRCIDIIRHLLR